MKKVIGCILALVMVAMPAVAFARQVDVVPASETNTVQFKYLDPTEFKVSDSDRVFTAKSTDTDASISTTASNGKGLAENLTSEFKAKRYGSEGEDTKNGVKELEEKTLENQSIGEDRKAPAGKEITGWKFDGWYTEPVSYAFWGDTTKTRYSEYEPIPFQYNLEGKEYEKDLLYKFNYGDDTKWDATLGEINTTPTLTTYWIWLSTLGDGTQKDIEVVKKDSAPSATASYAGG